MNFMQAAHAMLRSLQFLIQSLKCAAVRNMIMIHLLLAWATCGVGRS